MELVKQSGWSKARVRMHHFRTAAGREVDLVLEDAAGRVVGVEVKWAASLGSEDFRGLRALQEAAGAKFHRGVILHQGRETVVFDDAMVAVPVEAVWKL